jgi:hypothetical protein
MAAARWELGLVARVLMPGVNAQPALAHHGERQVQARVLVPVGPARQHIHVGGKQREHDRRAQHALPLLLPFRVREMKSG